MYSLFSQENIVHRDLKPQNIMIDEKGQAFISDVGIAKQFEGTMRAKRKETITTAGGDKNWMSPEMLKAFHSDQDIHAYLSKIDVFSLGLITLNAIDIDGYEKHKGKLNIDRSLLENYLQDLEKKGLITDKEFLPILKRMLAFDIESRISIDNLYKWMVYLNTF